MPSSPASAPAAFPASPPVPVMVCERQGIVTVLLDQVLGNRGLRPHRTQVHDAALERRWFKEQWDGRKFVGRLFRCKVSHSQTMFDFPDAARVRGSAPAPRPIQRYPTPGRVACIRSPGAVPGPGDRCAS